MCDRTNYMGASKRLRSNAMAATEFRTSRVRLYISEKSVPAVSACGRPRLRRYRRKVRDLGRGGHKEFGSKKNFQRRSFSSLRRICPNQRSCARKCGKSVRVTTLAYSRMGNFRRVWSQKKRKTVTLYDADCGGTDFYDHLRIFYECGHKNP